VTDRLLQFVALADRHPRIVSLLAGALAACAFPPLVLWPLALFGVAVLVWQLARTNGWRTALATGWLFGWAHYTVANNWIATAFTYQAEMPAWLGLLAVPLLALYLAIYPGLAAVATWAIARGRGGTWLAGCTLAGCWIVAEWFKAWLFTGYSWAPLGLAFLGSFDRPGIAAILPWIGTYALSGLVVLSAAALLAFAQARRWLPLGALAVLLIVGMYLPAGKRAEGTLAFTLVQPDVRQEELNDTLKFEEQFVRIAKLSLPRSQGQQRLVLWPESGVPDYLEDGYPQRYYDQVTANGDPRFARWRIGRVIGENSLLLTGAVDLNVEGGRAASARNSITVLTSGGEIAGSYAKAHLVPYGEYLALRWLLEPLGASRLVAGSIDFVPGPGPRTLSLGPWGRAGMQICYEIIFSGAVVDRKDRPDYIFNPSNDGWFGAWGPPQHLAQARMRAIEEGLPVLRATTTGISAVIDADGVVRSYIPRHRADRIDGTIPPPKPPTPFAQLGNVLPLGWALLILAASLVALRRRRS